MRIPEALRSALDDEIARVERAELARAAAELSKWYRGGTAPPLIAEAERAAYLATRLPATYAANAAVFREFKARVEQPVRSVLDLGAGPGTSMWAAAETLPSVDNFTALERNPALIAAGRRLARRSSRPGLQRAMWVPDDLRGVFEVSQHDVVVMSYSLGELTDPQSVARSAWELANVALVLIEPGTRAGFGAIVRARDLLIGLGAHIAAPCPHHNACPLAVRDDWCHFSARLERTSEHRQLKGADLGYEDEKFSYLIATKAPTRPAQTRIVRHPLKHPGHIKLTLCTPQDLQQPTISKSQKELYRAARKAEWGDAWPPEAESRM